MQKKSIIVATMIVVAVIVLASVLLLPRLVQSDKSNVPPVEDSNVVFTNQTVYVFGYSPNTELIMNRLHLSTSNVTLVTNTSVLSNLTGRFVLLIDGECFFNTYNYSIAETAKAVQPLILNGTPVVLLNRSVDFFYFAAPDIHFGYSQSSSDGYTIIPLINGIKLVPGSTSASTWSLGGSINNQFGQSITAAYNWGVRNLDAPSP
jgi:hypothetical protein